MSTAPNARVARFLDELPWAYTTTPRQALGFEFQVRVMDPELGEYLDGVLVRTPGGSPARHVYSVVDRGEWRRGRFPVFLDGARIALMNLPNVALNHLMWSINQQVLAHSAEWILVHASAVEFDGVAVVCPAPMESGKTTLAAGLVQAGLRYLTDEAVAIDPATLLVQPYPKALSIDPGSWEVLGALEPDVSPGARQYLGSQWHVPPDAIHPDAVAPTCTPRFIIAPRYEEGATTSLEPMSRAEALSVMASNSFNVASHGPVGFQALAAVVRGSACYRLRMGSLEEACRLIIDCLRRAHERTIA